ncbi:hypothetical protein C1H57_12525 [Clostridium sp. 2-1]|uniref:hypothetical protein n=1 Tax=Clostridium TaxID=1485 RepID=UPI000CDA75B5|nr:MULTISPECIES: hypothetical protein [Clostridium]MBN7576008.1 hypothetical protein [Clostridium beijerinckii]MBN7581159.1 hypothetical protein [Clostridium beijerinckii]MBN7585729.1 hypothetical protein [Clostridium beijerinckii]MBO0521518.1 hypothetical protein [Clostridium beijerinckii]POO91007.1 hypothetical protein C1H57_12525 [Clostridium sp. 2-1]
MINKNRVQCEKCKAELNLKKIPIESKHIGEIRIQFFRCPSCYEKYLIDVTDKATREKQIEYARLGTYQKQLMESVNKDNLEAIEQLTLKNKDKMEVLLKEIKDTKAMLKEKYGTELNN